MTKIYPQGLPPLNLQSLATGLKERDLTANIATVPGHSNTYDSSKMLAPLNPFLSPMTLEVKEDPAILQPSLEPLSSLTRVLLQNDLVPPRVVEGLIRLQEMEDASLRVHEEDDEEKDTLCGLDEESFNLENNFTASITKFADLKGKDKEEVVRWRKSGKAEIKLKIDPEYVNMVKQNIQEGMKVGEHSLKVRNKRKRMEMSDFTRLSAKDREVKFESRRDYLRGIYRSHWSTERSNVWAPKPTGDKFLRLEKRNYWFHHPGDFHMGIFERTYTRPSNSFKPDSRKVHKIRRNRNFKVGGRDPGLPERIFGSLPAHYSWTVNYLASYALLQPLDLHKEVAELERLLLVLDPNFFGMRRVVKLEDPQAEQEREERAAKKAKREKEMARQEELAAREEAVKAAASRLKRRQSFLDMSPRDQGWWSLRKVKAGETRCGVCEACWTAGEEKEELQCLGLTYKPTAPSSPIRCMRCEHCTAKVCGKCSMCKEGKDRENNQEADGRKADCIWNRHCARNCGVCDACREKEEFGGEPAGGTHRSCLVKGKLVVEQEIKVIEEDTVLEHLAEWVQNVRSKQPSSLEEIKSMEMAAQPAPRIRDKILAKCGDSEVEEVWKKLVEMSFMMETTSFTTEEVYMKAQYICTICQKKSSEVLMFSKGAQGETICTVPGNYIKQANRRKKNVRNSRKPNQSIRLMREAHLRHMVCSHIGSRTKGNLPGFGNDEKTCGQKVSPKKKQKAEQKGKQRLECDLCDFFSSSKVKSANTKISKRPFEGACV